jgi:hypothetical protein
MISRNVSIGFDVEEVLAGANARLSLAGELSSVHASVRELWLLLLGLVLRTARIALDDLCKYDSRLSSLGSYRFTREV